MKQKNIKIPKLLIINLFIGLVLIGNNFSIDVKAQTLPSTSNKYTVLAPLPCIEGGGITCEKGNGALETEVDFKTYVQYTINLLIGLSAVVAVVMIVWGGFEYMYTASFSNKKMGIEKVTNAIYGLILILTSYIILRTIDPRLVEIPNTLVPEIQVEQWLQQDAKSLLTNRVIDDVSKTQIRGIDIGKEIETKRAEELEKKQKIKEINSKLSNIDISTPEGKLQSETLEIEQKKAAESLRSLEIEHAIASAKQSFNGQISNTLLEFSDNITSRETVQSKIKLLNTNIENIEKLETEKTKQLKDLGAIDTSAIKNEAEYAKTVVDMYKINLVILSAQKTEQNDGASYVELVKMDGSNDMFIDDRKSSGSKKAKDYVNEQISDMTKRIDTFKSVEIKNDLTARLNKLSGFLTTNEILNRK